MDRLGSNWTVYERSGQNGLDWTTKNDWTEQNQIGPNMTKVDRMDRND